MRRRDLIGASGPSRRDSAAAAAPVSLAALGLPVIADGRIRNYVFVNLRLHLAPDADPARVRAKEPYFRDALVRAGHRTPFTVAGNWSRLDGEAIVRSVMGAATRLVGPRVVRRVEIVSQTPRRRAVAPA